MRKHVVLSCWNAEQVGWDWHRSAQEFWIKVTAMISYDDTSVLSVITRDVVWAWLMVSSAATVRPSAGSPSLWSTGSPWEEQVSMVLPPPVRWDNIMSRAWNEAIRSFAKVSIVSYSRPSLMIIASASQFHVYLPWGQRPFSIVS